MGLEQLAGPGLEALWEAAVGVELVGGEGIGGSGFDGKRLHTAGLHHASPCACAPQAARAKLTPHSRPGGSMMSTSCSSCMPTTAAAPDSSMRAPVVSSRTIQGWVQ
jgi:hypothetical protein